MKRGDTLRALLISLGVSLPVISLLAAEAVQATPTTVARAEAAAGACAQPDANSVRENETHLFVTCGGFFE